MSAPRHHRPVSYYALFQGWLLLSQPPGCLCTVTTLPTEIVLWDLSWRSGLFPSRPRILAPVVSLPRHPLSIRRLVRVGKLDAPVSIRLRYLPGDCSREAVPKYISGRTSYLWVRLAFHPYPQVIPTVCNRYGFGPPRACSARFTLPMGRSPSFGSVARHLSPFRTRVRSGSGCPCLNLATNYHSSAHSTKGTPSHRLGCSDWLEAHGFRLSFTPLAGVLFTVPSRYWFPIGRLLYLALGRGRPCFPPDSACRMVLTITSQSPITTVAYGTLTPSGQPFQCCSASSD